ncbi:MAG TPA: hypothetical protein VIP11_15315 [Gemmatimonadaceae bacterium]
MDPESQAAMCANAARDEWSVSLAPDSTQLVIQPAHVARFGDTTRVAGGRLTAEDHGEFGGDVWWHPDSGARVHVARTNLHTFIQARDTVWGLTGLAHMSLNTGQLVRFDRVAGRWQMMPVADLGAAPEAVIHLSHDTLLVLAVERVIRISPTHSVELLHANPVWGRTYPTSIARDREGLIYLGMRSGVARLTPRANGYSEDWLVPTNCRRRMPSGALRDCRCVG